MVSIVKISLMAFFLTVISHISSNTLLISDDSLEKFSKAPVETIGMKREER